MDDDLAALVKDDTREKMGKAIDHVRHEMGNVRTGRASSALIETLMVDYYGTPTPLRQLAGFSVPDAMLLVISPYDKGSLAAIEKAIMASDLGINPTNDGTVIRLAFPPLTEERRKELVKVVRHKAEEGRVAVRNLRRGGRHELEALQKDGELSTDELERVEKELEKITHDQVALIDQLLVPQRARAATGLRNDTPMPDDTDDYEDVNSPPTGLGDPGAEGIDEDPPSYHSGRVRIIGAEPAGDTVREVTGPVADEHPELPHWNDAPTGRSRRCSTAAPARSSSSRRRHGARRRPTGRPRRRSSSPPCSRTTCRPSGRCWASSATTYDVERQPWHFESDDTLVIPPEPGSEPEPAAGRCGEPEPEPVSAQAPPDEPDARAGRRLPAGRVAGHRGRLGGRRITPQPARAARAHAQASLRAHHQAAPTCAPAT